MLNKFVLFAPILIPLTFMLCSCNICESEDENMIPLRDLTSVEKSLVSADNNFGLNLFKSLHSAKPNENLFISPLSVSLALGMTLNGANGETYEAIKTTLELNGFSEDDINKSYQTLIELLTNLDEEVVFNITNSIWHRDNFNVEQNFIDLNKEYFNAEVQGLNFSNPTSKDVINDWVYDKTNGLIDKILDENIPAEIVMYLINAIYFKGVWSNEFDTDDTKEESFNNYDGSVSSVPLMFQEEDFNYLENDKYQAVELMYGDSIYSMMVVLPKQGVDINNLADTLNVSDLSNQYYSTGLHLYLPKFELEWKASLNSVLKSMGMDIAFNESQADFTRINPNGGLYIDEALHKSYIKVDEEGTEAAAITSIGVSLTSMPQTTYFRVDRPFIFVIRDHHSNTILFIGKVLEL